MRVSISILAVSKALALTVSVIYAGFSLPETLDEVPQILAGRPPPAASLHTQIASNSFDRCPLAIAVGGGYNDTAFDALRKACIEACGSEEALGIAFFRTDRQLTERLFAEGKGPGRKSAEYPKAITKRLKDKLAEVGVAQGLQKEDVGKVFWY